MRGIVFTVVGLKLPGAGSGLGVGLQSILQKEKKADWKHWQHFGFRFPHRLTRKLGFKEKLKKL